MWVDHCILVFAPAKVHNWDLKSEKRKVKNEKRLAFDDILMS